MYRLEKCNSHDRPVVIEMHETGSVTSEEESLEKPVQVSHTCHLLQWH